MKHTRKYIFEESGNYEHGLNELSYKSGVSESYLKEMLKSKDKVKDYLHDGYELQNLMEGKKHGSY